jgi:hypothetical protein
MPIHPKIDLDALEATALKVVNKSKYVKSASKITKKAQSSLAKVKIKYAKDLASEVGKWRRKEITYSKFLKNTQSIMQSTYERAYTLGTEAQSAGKLKILTPVRKLTADERVWLKFEVRDELYYWKRFMGALKKYLFKVDPAGIDLPLDVPSSLRTELKNIKLQHYRRFNMYVDALDAVHTQGRVSRLPTHVLINWVFSEAEHCPECVYLEKMSPYVKETLPTVPRAGKTRCLTHCKCVLAFQRVDERQYSLIKEYSSRKNTHLKRLMKTRGLTPSLAHTHIKKSYKT